MKEENLKLISNPLDKEFPEDIQEEDSKINNKDHMDKDQKENKENQDHMKKDHKENKDNLENNEFKNKQLN